MKNNYAIFYTNDFGDEERLTHWITHKEAISYMKNNKNFKPNMIILKRNNPIYGVMDNWNSHINDKPVEVLSTEECFNDDIIVFIKWIQSHGGKIDDIYEK